jgi:tricarballylate dehydrogenase
MRCNYDGVEDLKVLMPDLTPDEFANTNFGTYTEERFFDDIGRVIEYRAVPVLVEIPGEAEPRHSALGANQGRALPADLWAAGLQGGRPVHTIDEPPFEAYAVTCGITFTFGGLKINIDAQAIDTDGQPIPGLYAAGELVGGIFYFNYPGGTGLANGAVFGRIAGARAGERARGVNR